MEIQGANLANCDFPAIENIEQNWTLANLRLTPQNENPGAAATASGVKDIGQNFKTEEYRKRAEAATALCLAIAECDTSDACEIMAAALADLGKGAPIPVFMSVVDDARWWAGNATTIEIKAFAMACCELMTPRVRKSFLGYVQRGVAA